jgi:ADP-ribose pyrophosphatase
MGGRRRRTVAEGPRVVARPFSGRGFSVRVEQWPGKDGRWLERDIVERADAAAVVAEVGGGLVLVRQFRPAVGQTLWELPAGRVDPGETPAAAAIRELQEETGYVADAVTPIAAIYPSPGYTTEQVWFFFADHPRPGRASPEADEDLTVRVFPPEELRTLLHGTSPVNGLLWVGAHWWLTERERQA